MNDSPQCTIDIRLPALVSKRSINEVSNGAPLIYAPQYTELVEDALAVGTCATMAVPANVVAASVVAARRRSGAESMRRKVVVQGDICNKNPFRYSAE